MSISADPSSAITQPDSVIIRVTENSQHEPARTTQPPQSGRPHLDTDLKRRIRRQITGSWMVWEAKAGTADLAALRNRFEKQWLASLGMAHTAMPTAGCGELVVYHPEDEMALVERDVVRLEFAVHEAEMFAALREIRTPHLGSMIDPLFLRSARALVTAEMFLVKPATKPARFGIRVGAAISSELPEIDSAELAALCEVEGLQSEWATWATSAAGFGAQPTAREQAADSRMPRFLDLVQLLASNGQLGADFNNLRQALFEAEQLLEGRTQDLADLADENRRIRHQMGSIKHSLNLAASPMAAPVATASPDDGSGRGAMPWLAGWAQANQERIVVLPRALGSAKKSIYENHDHVRQALEFLAGPYRDSRLSELDQESLAKALTDTGCQLRGSAGMSVAGTWGDEYFVSWDGRRRFMDLHITRGGGRDHRYCMRIYFFWDAASSRVVVGHLPSHLNNSLA